LPCQLDFHHRRAVGKSTIAEPAHRLRDAVGELQQPAPQPFEVIAPPRIARNESLVRRAAFAPTRAFNRSVAVP
jgi:hypothetical protein